MQDKRMRVCVLVALVGAMAVVGARDAAPRAAGGTAMAEKAHKKSGGATRPANAIKKDRDAATGAQGAMEKAPPMKGGPRSRAPYYQVHVDSRVGRYIDVYIDGNYEGTLPPYGDLYRWIEGGGTVLYAQTPDESYWWGPRTINLGSSYHWTLNP